jgi:ribonuclease-3
MKFDVEKYSALLCKVEEILKYSFNNNYLLFKALCHSSYSNELNFCSKEIPCPNNERLEFLGDAVIGLFVAERLMKLYPNSKEGKLSRWRSSLVSRKTLYLLANKIQLGSHLLLGKGEKRTKGDEKESILAAGFEAIVGAIYLDGGVLASSKFLEISYEHALENLEEKDNKIENISDYKTHLQEVTQSKFRIAPKYRLANSWGPEHEKIFEVEIILEQKILAKGTGKSKKEAEQQAAFQALITMTGELNDIAKNI